MLSICTSPTPIKAGVDAIALLLCAIQGLLFVMERILLPSLVKLVRAITIDECSEAYTF